MMDNLCFGMEVLNITQLPRGAYSHANQAVDLGGKDTGRDYWYARGETYWKCTCCWYSGTNTYHFLSCDSSGNPTKVHCADGVDRIVTVSLTHDNNARIIGKLYHDEIMFQEGTKYPTSGKVTGNHIHLEIAEGDVRQRYKANNGTWTLYNELNPLEVMFVDTSFTTIKSTLGASVKTCSGINYTKGDDTKMTLKDGFQSITYQGANLKVFKGYGDYKQLHMLSALGTEKATQDIKNYDHSNMVIMAEANCNYFEMSSKTEYGQHYGVEQSEGDGVHTSSLDLAPKNSAYEVFYQLKDGTCGRCTADNYWLSKDDVIFACTPYATVVFNGEKCNYKSSAFGNKDTTANSQTMYMLVDDSWVIVCTGSKVLPSVLQSYAIECGAKHAFIVDSGGSTQMMAYTTKWESIIYTGRHIPNVLALAKVKVTDTDDKGDDTPTTDTVSKEEYDKLKAEKDVLQEEYDSLEVHYKELGEEYDALQNEVTVLENKITEIKKIVEE